MSDVNEKVVKITGIKIFLVLAFVAIGVLSYKICELNQKLKYYAEMSDEFHENLYARVEGSYKEVLILCLFLIFIIENISNLKINKVFFI